MDTNSIAVFALRVSRRGAKNVAVVGVVGCLAVTFAAAVSGAGVAFSTQADIVAVDRTHKGNRLPLAPKHSTVSSPVLTKLPRPPIGCEPAFSRVADPKRSHIFGRCIS